MRVWAAVVDSRGLGSFVVIRCNIVIFDNPRMCATSAIRAESHFGKPIVFAAKESNGGELLWGKQVYVDYLEGLEDVEFGSLPWKQYEFPTSMPPSGESQREPHYLCHGTGQLTCPVCNGSGLWPRPRTCYRCRGHKTIKCGPCDGTGSL